MPKVIDKMYQFDLPFQYQQGSITELLPDAEGDVNVFVSYWACPKGGWTFYADKGKCYKFFDHQKMTYEEASKYCRAFGQKVSL